MSKNILLIILFVFGFLVFGCTAPSEPSGTTTPTPTTEPISEPTPSPTTKTFSSCTEIITFEEVIEACGITVEPAKKTDGTSDPYNYIKNRCGIRGYYSGGEAYENYQIIEFHSISSWGTYDKVRSRNMDEINFEDLSGIGLNAHKYITEPTAENVGFFAPVNYIVFEQPQNNIWLLKATLWNQMPDSSVESIRPTCESFESLKTIAVKIADRLK
ncbi:hypothetical protein HY488_00085 [Candidatus Woesearchaeota archaeon]|nr:hypothetical protein [Candidatus Woesearchaeota archaeon]